MSTEAEYEAAISKADYLNDIGKTEEAKSIFTQGLKQSEAEGNEAFIHCFRAQLAHIEDNRQKALEESAEAFHLNPDSPLLSKELGVALSSVDRSEEALEFFDKALQLKHDYVPALYWRASMLGLLSRREEALDAINEAAALSPDDPDIRTIQGGILADQGKQKEALKCFDAVLKVEPEYYPARLGRAITLGFLKRNKEAVRELRALLKERPDDETLKSWLFRFVEKPDQARNLEQKQRLERWQRRREEREREIKLDAWRKLSARTAHRVDNQLFAAKGAVRTLNEQAEPGLSEPISDIEACLDRLGRICSEFRRYSTDQPPKPQPTDVHVLLHDAVRRYSKSADGIQIQEDIAPLLPECRWDMHQIDQAISELLENAIRHTHKGKSIIIKAEPREKEGRQFVRIIVTNYDGGIDARYKDRVFDPFFSLRPGGTGLGLAIVSQIIKNHEGSIRETGEPGKFARFEIELPAQMGKEDSP